MPVEVRSGVGLYQLHRRKQAGQIVLNYVGPDGIANNADDPQLSAAQFAKTSYGDRFLYGIRTPPLVDPYKFAEFMRANPNAVQDIQGVNIQRQRVNTQQMAQDVTSAYVAGTVKLSSKLTLLGGLRGEQTENFVRGAIRINSLGVPILAQGFTNTSKPYFNAIYSQTQRATGDYTDYFPNYQATYRFTPDVVLRAALTRAAPDFLSLTHDLDAVLLAHDTADLEAIDPSGGALRQAADALSTRAQNADLSASERRVAATALAQLFAFVGGEEA